MFNYTKLVEEALLGVVKNLLKYVAKDGLSGDHHFYISFRTQHPEVEIPAFLKNEHPETITIVLQYEFDSLRVSDSSFGVRLRFNKTHHFLHIPFEAVTAFSDPSEQFQLFFSAAQKRHFQEDMTPSIELPYENEEDKIISLDSFRKKT